MLLARRHRYTGTLSYYRFWTPEPVPLARPIAIASARWTTEEDHQLSKQATSLDAGQVIRWRSWHRWTAICLLLRDIVIPAAPARPGAPAALVGLAAPPPAQLSTAKPTNAGTPTPRQRHDHNELQVPYQSRYGYQEKNSHAI